MHGLDVARGSGEQRHTAAGGTRVHGCCEVRGSLLDRMVVPQIHMHLGPVNMTFIRNSVFAEVMKLRDLEMRSSRIEGGP